MSKVPYDCTDESGKLLLEASLQGIYCFTVAKKTFAWFQALRGVQIVLQASTPTIQVSFAPK